MKAGCWDTPLTLRDLAEAIPIISDNRLPLLTENNFQTRSLLFGPSPLAYWYLGYLSDPPAPRPSLGSSPPYYLELESKGLPLRFTVILLMILKRFLETLQRCIQNPLEYLRRSIYRKWSTAEIKKLYFCEKLHLRCSTGFWIHLCFMNLNL